MPRKPRTLVLDSWAVLAYGRGGSQYSLAVIVLREGYGNPPKHLSDPWPVDGWLFAGHWRVNLMTQSEPPEFTESR